MRFTITMVAATSLSRELPWHQRAIRAKDRQILLDPHPALSASLRLLTRDAPVPVHNAVRGVEELFSTSPKSLRSMRMLPHHLSPAPIPIGALSARILECSPPAMDGSDIWKSMRRDTPAYHRAMKFIHHTAQSVCYVGFWIQTKDTIIRIRSYSAPTKVWLPEVTLGSVILSTISRLTAFQMAPLWPRIGGIHWIRSTFPADFALLAFTRIRINWIISTVLTTRNTNTSASGMPTESFWVYCSSLVSKNHGETYWQKIPGAMNWAFTGILSQSRAYSLG